MWRALLIGVCVTGLSACGVVFPYEASGSCPQMGEGVCASVRQVYHDTQGHVSPGRVADGENGTGSPPVPAPGAVISGGQGGRSAAAGATMVPANASPAAPATATNAQAGGAQTGPAQAGGADQPGAGGGDRKDPYIIPVVLGPDGALPLRAPPEVLRIWIAPWVTKDGDLVMSGYVFTELRDRTWQVGGQSVVGAGDLRPASYEPVMAPVVNAPVPPGGAGTSRPAQGSPPGVTQAGVTQAAAPDMRGAGTPVQTSQRPLVRTSAGPQPGAPGEGFWQTAPGGAPVQ
jgi:type IV conjugative transfer system lipoprotein TraV